MRHIICNDASNAYKLLERFRWRVTNIVTVLVTRYYLASGNGNKIVTVEFSVTI